MKTGGIKPGRTIVSKRVTVTVPDDLYEDILIVAAAQDRSVSNLIVHSARSEVKKRITKYKITEKIKSPRGEK